MSLRSKVTAALVAASIAMVPTIASAAQASAASKLSVRSAPAVQNAVRAGGVKNDANQLGGSLLIAALAAAAVIAGIIIAASGSDSP